MDDNKKALKELLRNLGRTSRSCRADNDHDQTQQNHSEQRDPTDNK